MPANRPTLWLGRPVPRRAAPGEPETQGCLVLALGLVGTIIAAWFTHVVLCLQTGAWGFLIAGALCFPVAIVHGIGHWFGAW